MTTNRKDRAGEAQAPQPATREEWPWRAKQDGSAGHGNDAGDDAPDAADD